MTAPVLQKMTQPVTQETTMHRDCGAIMFCVGTLRTYAVLRAASQVASGASFSEQVEKSHLTDVCGSFAKTTQPGRGRR